MGILSQWQSDPTGTLILLLYRAPAVLIALTLHELAHGYIALRCGDPTAQMLGRLSFNPLKHLDPVGTLFMFLFGFGWAKPVPVNPRNFRRFRRDDLMVSVAGVTVNFCLFLIATLAMAGVNEILWKPDVWALGPLTTRRDFLSFSGYNFYAVFSSQDMLFVQAAGTKAYYLEGAAGFLRVPWLIYVQRFLMHFSMINLGLAVFNLLPIPPLDGYHVLNDVFLRGRLHLSPKVLQGMTVGLLILFYATRFLSEWIGKAVNAIQGGAVAGILAIFGLG